MRLCRGAKATMFQEETKLPFCEPRIFQKIPLRSKGSKNPAKDEPQFAKPFGKIITEAEMRGRHG